MKQKTKPQTKTTTKHQLILKAEMCGCCSRHSYDVCELVAAEQRQDCMSCGGF